MKRQKMQIGHPLALIVTWYDSVPEPPVQIQYDGEVVGWRESQVIVRVKEYAVLRFWKNTGIEVGNPDHQRRGFRVNLDHLAESVKPAKGVEIDLDAVPVPIDTEV